MATRSELHDLWHSVVRFENLKLKGIYCTPVIGFANLKLKGLMLEGEAVAESGF